ncbi:MAG: L-seryl-tRNA selenium transferase [Dehalococcoidia bacterium]|nr:L-seryl-tRNA selenium transferase [Dehalococcoidia bacterium]
MVTKAVEEIRRRGKVYRDLGVRPIINAQGTSTTLGGSMVDPVAAEAMAAASHSMIILKELSGKAGELIAKHTGAEAGLVTSGAAGGMLLQAAAVIAGSDAGRIKRLPDTSGLKNEILVLDHHKDIGYMQSWRSAGAVLKPVEITGVEIGEAAAAKVVASATGNTAAIGYIASRWLRPDPPGFLKALCVAAHAKGLPVIVDAAAMLPPVSNLRAYTADGADLVAFSGGKAIRAPQSSGILAGRRDLIAAAEANNSPHSAVGRPLKVCKEEIVGLMVALDRYVKRDHANDQARWRKQMEYVASRLHGVRGVRAAVMQDDFSRPVPEVAIFFERDYTGPTAQQIDAVLESGDPPIITGHASPRGESMFINAHNVAEGEEVIIAEYLRAALERR